MFYIYFFFLSQTKFFLANVDYKLEEINYMFRIMALFQLKIKISLAIAVQVFLKIKGYPYFVVVEINNVIFFDFFSCFFNQP